MALLITTSSIAVQSQFKEGQRKSSCLIKKIIVMIAPHFLYRSLWLKK
jgi:hypothetical protein